MTTGATFIHELPIQASTNEFNTKKFGIEEVFFTHSIIIMFEIW
jgi:hypothetical protein